MKHIDVPLVDFNTAAAAKTAGFEEATYSHYYWRREDWYLEFWDADNYNGERYNSNGEMHISVPPQDQLVEWVMDRKQLLVFAHPRIIKHQLKWRYGVLDLDDGLFSVAASKYEYDSRTEAINDGLAIALIRKDKQ